MQWRYFHVVDVINVSGHRLGTAEVESALNSHPACAESAVIGFHHDVKGQGIFAYCILRENCPETPELVKELKTIVREQIGPFASPGSGYDTLH